jgi:hypothetical protein
MGVVVGTLFRKRTVRNLSGQVVDMRDDADGGIIISKGQVVNQEKINEIAAKEKDRQTAAVASTVQVDAPDHVAEERVTAPTKIQEIEKKIAEQDTKLDAILALLSKK